MGNNVTLIPKKPERHSLLTSTEDVVYMPLGSKDSHGILQVGDNLVVDKGIVSLDLNGDWYQKVLEALELSKSEILILDADGVQTSSGVEFTIKNYEDFEKYKTDKRRFLIKMKLPVLNNIDKDNRVYIHFGSTRYLVFSFVKGMNNQLTLKDLQAVVRKDTDGYSYFANFIYLDSPEFNGFILDPAASAGTVTGLKPDGVTIGINKDGALNAIALDDGFISVNDKINFDDFKGFVHLTQGQYDRLKTYGEIDIAGKVLKYDDSLVYITPDVAVPSNHNLLINGDFRVNQRNWTTGNSAGYTVDRWKNVNTFGTITANTDGTITVSASGGPAYFIQKLEQQDGNRIKGKTVNLSCCDVDGNIYSKSGTISSSGSSEPSLKTEWGYLRLFYNANPNIFEATIHVNDGKSITLKWVKLEIGSVATDFNPRPYAEELAMCQRFYQVLGVNNSGFSDFGESQVDGVGYYMVNTPVPLTSILPRTNPTVTVLTSPNIRNYNNLNVLAIDYYSITSPNNNQIILKFYANGVERGVIYHMYNGRISLDAEL